VPQLTLTVLGMTALLGFVADAFEWVRWLGVAYLIYIGLRQWLAPSVDLTKIKPQQKSARAIVTRGFLVSLSNPKTLLFYGAFFPQFITIDKDPTAQVIILSLTFLGLAMFWDGLWALLAGRARGLLARRGKLRNRLCGGVLMAAGVGLALAHRR